MSQPAVLNLFSAATFGVLAGAAVTNTGATTINGDLGSNTAASISGFYPSGPGTYTGTEYIADSNTVNAIVQADAAYMDGLSRSVTANLTGQTLGSGGTIDNLVGGVYKFDSSTSINGTLTLDWAFDTSSVWIFVIGSTLETITGCNVFMKNIPGSKMNTPLIPIFWLVGSSATLDVGSSINGTIIAQASITDNGATSDALIALTGAVTFSTAGIVTSYDNSIITGADPHIISLDGSRLDVYEAGFYRMFDSNSENRMLINTEIIRCDTIDMYNKFFIIYPNGNQVYVTFTVKGIEVEEKEFITYYDTKWVSKTFLDNNKYYIIEIELAQRSFFMRTNNGPYPVSYRGLLTGEIIEVDGLSDISFIEGSRSIIPNYYKYNALLCGSTSPHIVKFNKEQFFSKQGTFRLLQDENLIINVTLDENKLMRRLKIGNDLFEWVGEHHWELVMFHNGVQIVEKSFIKEYLTKNLIVRIQDNASVSIALRTLTHICGLFCGDIFEVSNINDTNCFLSKPYEYKVRTIVRSTSNYDKFIENL